MPIDIKTLSCQQCGSTDINMISDTQGICKNCGATFAVHQRIDTQNVRNEFHIHTGPEQNQAERICVKTELKPEYTQSEFIRKAWIKLTDEDAPVDVFSLNFNDVSIQEREVVIDHVEVGTTYQVGIGYNRQEPYIGYETYYEEEPYIGYETYYENGVRKERQVTKYRKVRKERQVTKYRTVTDWSALNGSHSAQSTVIEENAYDPNLDKDLFSEELRKSKKSSAVTSTYDDLNELKVVDKALVRILAAHYKNIEHSIQRSLPGDHYRDLNWKVSDTNELRTTLYKAPEYKVSISYNGKTYTKYAFPFGSMNIHGDTINNENSLWKITHEKRDTIPKIVWGKTKAFTFITLALLLTSIIVSLVVRIIPLTIIAFAVAVATFIANTIFVKKTENNISEIVNTEIKEYSSKYKAKQREILNNKLESLGFEPATVNEL